MKIAHGEGVEWDRSDLIDERTIPLAVAYISEIGEFSDAEMEEVEGILVALSGVSANYSVDEAIATALDSMESYSMLLRMGELVR